MKELINVSEIIDGTTSNDDGMKLFIALKLYLDKSVIVVLSLKDSGSMSTSFLNSSLGEIISIYGYNFFKNHIRIVDYTNSQIRIISRYIEKVKQLKTI